MGCDAMWMDARIVVELGCLVCDDYYCSMRVRDSRRRQTTAPAARRRWSGCPVSARRSLSGSPIDYSEGWWLYCVDEEGEETIRIRMISIRMIRMIRMIRD